jgi:hypothetical protein
MFFKIIAMLAGVIAILAVGTAASQTGAGSAALSTRL